MNKIEKVYITDELSMINARHIVVNHIKELKFRVLDQTKIVTAATELMRNILRYAGRGIVRIEHINNLERKALKLVFEDNGPGIEDINLAMRDGYTSTNGMGLGLPGSKRLMDEFEIISYPQKGTKITILKWVS